MRNLKRLLTMVMAIAMMMSLMVVGAGATAFKDDKDITHKDAVDKMVSLNIINGRDNGNFDPTGIVTRAELCKMVCVALSGGNDPKLSNTTVSTFTDTKGHWAQGYIEYCVNLGIVAGLGNNTFGPDQQITPSQAAKMLLVALGYDAAYEKFTGPTWALNSNKVAQQKGLYDEIQSIDPSAPMTRDAAAQMIFNFCDAKMVKYEFGISGSTGGAVTGVKQAVDSKILVNGVEKYETILNKYYKLNDDIKGIMTDWSYDNTKKEYKYTVTTKFGTPDTTLTFTTKNDFSKFFGMNVQVLYKDKNNDAKFDANNDEVYDFSAKDSKVVLSGIVNDFDPVDAAATDFKFNSVTYKLSQKAELTKVYMNGVWTATGKTLENYSKGADYTANAHYDFALIDNTGDDKGDIMVVYPYTVEKITYVDSKGASTNNKTYKFDDCEISKDIAKNDWVKIVADKNAPMDRDTLTKVAVVTGEISSIKSSTKIVVDGKTYKNAVGATGDLGYKIGNKMELVTLNGFTFNAKKLSDSINKDKILLVTNADEIGKGTDAGKQQIKVLLADGTKKVVKTDKIDDMDVSTTNHFDDSTAGTTDQYALNTVYTYSIDKDGNYELTPVRAGTNESYEAQKTVTTATTLKDGKVTASGTTLRFADDAVVFYFDGKKSEFKATTGKSVSTWNETAVNTSSTLYANETDGFMYTQVAFLKLDNAPSDKDYKYGYIIADPELMKVGDDYYYQLKIWNGKENITVKAESTGYGDNDTSSTASVMANDINVKKGTPVRYKVSGDGIVEMVTSLAVIDKVSGVEKNSVNAVVGYTDGKNAVAFQSPTFGAKDNTVKDLKITSDTVVVRYSSEDTEGQTGNGITVAKETPVSGVYYQNCYVVANSDNEIEALIIDKDSSLGSVAAPAPTVTLTNATLTAPTGALAAGSTTNLTNWITSTQDSVKINVATVAGATATVKIDNGAYTSGTAYTFPSAKDYVVTVEVAGTGVITTTYTYTLHVTAPNAAAPTTVSMAAAGTNGATVNSGNLLTGVGSVTGWVTGSKDAVKFTVSGAATYTVKINNVAHNVANDYVIAAAGVAPGTTYNVEVTATAVGFTTATYNYTFTAVN